jgi:hypothetical protein
MKRIHGFLNVIMVILFLGLFSVGCQNEKPKSKSDPAALFFLINRYNQINIDYNNAINTYPQNIMDLDTTFIIDRTLSNLYNTYISGTPGTSSANISGNCPKAGTFSITGSYIGGKPTTVNLSYSLNGCMDTITLLKMTGLVALTGVITETGTIATPNNITHSSSSILLKGTQTDTHYTIGSPINWNSSCAFSSTSTDSSYNATFCGRTTSY